MNPTLVMILVALAVGSAVLGLYSLLSDLFLHDRDRLNARVCTYPLHQLYPEPGGLFAP